MKEVVIYTDGACSGNPGVGGWAGILIYKDVEKIVSGGNIDTTNNRMELFAIIQSLRCLKEKCKLTIYSDSAYALEPFLKGWISLWTKNNWKTASGSAVKNTDLWTALLLETAKHEITWVKVKGHSDNVYNNRCDEIARSEIKKIQK
ncbi:MAG: ribonuclease HI [Christensenellales bacterium]